LKACEKKQGLLVIAKAKKTQKKPPPQEKSTLNIHQYEDKQNVL